MKLLWKILLYTNVILTLFGGLVGGAHLALGNTGWFFFSIGLTVMSAVLAKICYNYGYDSG